MSTNYTEEDLSNLIHEKLKDCKDLPMVCKYTQTESGIKRVTTRIKEIVFNDGITDLDAALAKVEDELEWGE